MAANYKIYTIEAYANLLLDQVGYCHGIYGMKLLENSCGEGNILVLAVKRYIQDALDQGVPLVEICAGLERDITGIDNDARSCQVCREKLSDVAKEYGLGDVNFNIINKNALHDQEKDFDFVVGNPPYVTYHDIPSKEIEYLREHFQVCKKGRFDYCYAFVEKALLCLKENGRMAYLLPNSILKNVWAKSLREYMKPYICNVIDLKNCNAFEKDVTVSTVILCLSMSGNLTNVCYECIGENEKLLVAREDLLDKWFFVKEPQYEHSLRFGDYFLAANSVATLYNEAFLVRDFKIENEKYVLVDGKRIERAVLKRAISPGSLRRQEHYFIIFPYLLDPDGRLRRYDCDTFNRQFPETVKYLQKYKAGLRKRKADKGNRWFEYGRSQAIQHVQGNKLIMPMVITGKNVVYEGDEGAVPFAGYYIRSINMYDLSIARNILESDEFLEYVKNHGVPTSRASIRISVKEINAYKFNRTFLNGG